MHMKRCIKIFSPLFHSLLSLPLFPPLQSLLVPPLLFVLHGFLQRRNAAMSLTILNQRPSPAPDLDRPVTFSCSSFSLIWMKPKCSFPPKWSARRRSLSWRPRQAEQTSQTRNFCCWKLEAGIEFLYSSCKKKKKKPIQTK